MRDMTIFLLPVKNLTSRSCFSTPVSSNSLHEKFGDSRSFKADIGFLYFQDLLAKNESFGSKTVRGGTIPQRTRF